MAIILVFLLSIFVLIASRNHPVFTFWLLINLYFDPGGYQMGLFQNDIISRVNFTDIIFLLCLIPYFNIRNKMSVFKEDKYFNLFYKFIGIYMLYFVLVYGFLVPQISGRSDFITFIIKSRLYFMSFILIRPVYYFVKYGMKVHFNIITYLAAICLTLYFISLVSGLNLIPYSKFERYVNSGIMRIYLNSYGLFDWVLNLALIVLLLKIRIKNKRLLLYSGLLMAFTIFLTLTRRELIGRVFNVVIILIIVNYLFKSQRKIQLTKILVPLIILLGLLYITFPRYIGYVNDEYKNLSNLVTTGRDKEGGVDYRLAGTGDVILMKKLIIDNLVFGVGFTRYSYEDLSNFRDFNNPLAGLYAGGELPYLGSIGKVGIIGLLLFLPVYIIILIMSLKLYRILKNNNINIFLKYNLYELLFGIFALSIIINKFTFNLFNIFVETYNPTSFLGSAIILSFLIACYYNLSKTVDQHSKIPQNNSITGITS